MKDKYPSVSALTESERRGQDFRIRSRARGPSILIMAPHGGGIEFGTSEIAEAIAGNDYSFYAFEGLKTSGNRDLHVTSSRFDERKCLMLASVASRAIAIHGENSREKVVFIGGLDLAMLDRLRASLTGRGFCVKTHPNLNLQGQAPTNICNRTNRGMGVQLELSNGLRRSFFRSLSKNGRKAKTDRFQEFVAAVRAALE